MTEPPKIRLATEDDIPTILQFIHDLAAYEDASHEVEATEETLRDTLSFADPESNDKDTPGNSKSKPRGGPVYTFLVTPPTSAEPVGMAMFFYNYSTWRSAPGVYLEDLFVRPEYRGKGYGFTLLRKLAGEVRRIKGRRLEWSVLKWNEPSIKFYESIGAKRKNEWLKMEVEGDDVLNRLAGDPSG